MLFCVGEPLYTWSLLTVVLQTLRNDCVVEKVCPQCGCACWFSCSGLIFLGSGSVFQ